MSQRAGHTLRIDPGDVRARTSLAALIGQHVALKKRGRDSWACCPFHAEKTPSFKVDGSDHFFKCFGCDAAGDAFDYLRLAHGMEFREALEYLAVEAGLMLDRAGVKRPKAKPVARPDPRALSEKEISRQARALGIWRAAIPAGGTIVETYLRWRGITIPIPPTLRYHPGLRYVGSDLLVPCMIAAVQAPERHVIAIHRAFIREDGGGKADVDQQKMTLGPLRAGAVRLGPAGPVLGLAEGIETALSVMQIFDLPTWAALGSRLASVRLPPDVREVHLFADNGKRGHEAARKAAGHLLTQGLQVVLRFPPDTFGDWNDALRAESVA